MLDKSHARIDGEVHKITRVVEVDGARHTHRVHLGCGLTVDVHEARARDDERGLDADAATCPGCAAREAGAPTPGLELAHATPNTVLADIPTGLPCPAVDCGAPLYIRRKTGTVGCTAQGHDFTVPEVLATSMGLLRRLAEGSF